MVNILVHGLGQDETSWNEVKNQLNNSEINVETPSLFSIVKNYQVNYEMSIQSYLYEPPTNYQRLYLLYNTLFISLCLKEYLKK